jgi:hypothetical protein
VVVETVIVVGVEGLVLVTVVVWLCPSSPETLVVDGAVLDETKIVVLMVAVASGEVIFTVSDVVVAVVMLDAVAEDAPEPLAVPELDEVGTVEYDPLVGVDQDFSEEVLVPASTEPVPVLLVEVRAELLEPEASETEIVVVVAVPPPVDEEVAFETVVVSTTVMSLPVVVDRVLYDLVVVADEPLVISSVLACALPVESVVLTTVVVITSVIVLPIDVAGEVELGVAVSVSIIVVVVATVTAVLPVEDEASETEVPLIVTELVSVVIDPEVTEDSEGREIVNPEPSVASTVVVLSTSVVESSEEMAEVMVVVETMVPPEDWTNEELDETGKGGKLDPDGAETDEVSVAFAVAMLVVLAVERVLGEMVTVELGSIVVIAVVGVMTGIVKAPPSVDVGFPTTVETESPEIELVG